MKFISKHSNYRVVLRPGIPGNRMNGTETIPGIYIKFEGGMVDVNKEEHIEMMFEHPGFKDGSFIIAPGDGTDPHLALRKNIEPEHKIAEMVHGSIGKTIAPKPTVKISEEQKKIMIESAKKMATVMFLEMKKKDEENKTVQNETVQEEIPAVQEEIPVVQEETVVDPVVAPIKHPNLMAPEPEEDRSSVGGGQEENSGPVHVERIEADKVKVELKEEDGSILVEAKHAPVDPTAPRRGRPPKITTQNNK